MPKLFTKSAFNHAVECPMRAYYYRNSKEYAYHYEGPDGIAEVGDQFGALACVYEGVPEENIIQRGGSNPIEAQAKSIADTLDLLRKENIDIGEAAFATDKFLVYVDILHKRGDKLEIIEVKSKCIGANESLLGKNGNISSDYLEKILDVTFQKYVIQQFIKTHSKFSNLKVHASLMLANSDAVCDVDSLSSLLHIKFLEGGHREIECAPDICEKLQGKNRIDRIINVDVISDQIIADEIPNIAKKYFDGSFVKFVEKAADMYVNNRKDYSDCRFNAQCFKCPFYVEYEKRDDGTIAKCKEDEQKQNGRAECFQNLFGVDIVGKALIDDTKGGIKQGGLPESLKKNAWLEQKKFFLTDIDENEYVSAENATPEAFQRRTELSTDDLRYLHVHSVKTGSNDATFLKEAAKAEMSKWTYPLHFIDFETYKGAVPLFKGNHPNEEIAYQFSHHIAHEDGTFEHAGEYISLEAGKFPNFEFVRKLKSQLDDDEGTIFRYDIHENSILNAIRIQLIDSNETDKEELIRFIECITHPTGSCKVPFEPGVRDMKDLKEIAQKYFYHPSMGSSNSIKQVMPAILQSDSYFRENYGDNMDPYHNLPSLEAFAAKVNKDEFPADFDDSDVWNAEKQINCGGISKLDYVLLQAGRFNKLHTEAIRKASLRYCELDTLSMVRNWEYFRISTK